MPWNMTVPKVPLGELPEPPAFEPPVLPEPPAPTMLTGGTLQSGLATGCLPREM
jgi:hypothetical protein